MNIHKIQIKMKCTCSMRAEQLVFGKVWGGHVTLAQDAPGYYW